MITPHLRSPFSWDSQGNAHVDDQDTQGELESCLSNILNCFIGECAAVPTLGIPNLLFKNAPLDMNQLTQIIATWEPRARTEITESGNPHDPSSRMINVRIL